MLYFDTSFLVPLFVREQTTERIAGLFETLRFGELATSHWTRVEFAGMLSRLIRTGRLDTEAAQDADAQFQNMIRESFTLLLPNPDDFDRARTCLRRYETGLRAADALHLAIAWNRTSEAIYTLDKQLIAIGRKLGLPMTAGSVPGYDE